MINWKEKQLNLSSFRSSLFTVCHGIRKVCTMMEMGGIPKRHRHQKQTTFRFECYSAYKGRAVGTSYMLHVRLSNGTLDVPSLTQNMSGNYYLTNVQLLQTWMCWCFYANYHVDLFKIWLVHGDLFFFFLTGPTSAMLTFKTVNN